MDGRELLRVIAWTAALEDGVAKAMLPANSVTLFTFDLK